MTSTPNPTAERWRKKPVEIEAMRYDGENWVEIAQWLRVHDVRIGQTITRKASIPSLEGTMYASPGDWVIKGVQGEFYPCKPDIFEQTYEPASALSEGAPSEAQARAIRKLDNMQAILAGAQASITDAVRELSLTSAALVAAQGAAKIETPAPFPDCEKLIAEAPKWAKKRRAAGWLAEADMLDRLIGALTAAQPVLDGGRDE